MFETTFSICEPTIDGPAKGGPIDSSPLYRALRPCGVTVHEAKDIQPEAIAADGYGLVGAVRRMDEHEALIVEYEKEESALVELYQALPEPLGRDDALVTILFAFVANGCIYDETNERYYDLPSTGEEALLTARMFHLFHLADNARKGAGQPWAPGSGQEHPMFRRSSGPPK